MKNLDNTVDVGDAFERLTQLQMLTDPISKTQFANVWIAKQEAAELPERVRKYLNLPGRSLQAKPGLFRYERVHFSQGTQIAGELVSRFRQVHTG